MKNSTISCYVPDRPIQSFSGFAAYTYIRTLKTLHYREPSNENLCFVNFQY